MKEMVSRLMRVIKWFGFGSGILGYLIIIFSNYSSLSIKDILGAVAVFLLCYGPACLIVWIVTGNPSPSPFKKGFYPDLKEDVVVFCVFLAMTVFFPLIIVITNWLADILFGW